MNDPTLSKPFYLSRGGIFIRLMLRTPLLDEDRYHVGPRIALFVGLTWLPLLILSALEGALAGGNTQVTFLLDPGPYTRFLFALPLLVAADGIIDPLLATVVQDLETSGVLPDEARARFRGALLEITRRRDSVWVEVALIVLALILSLSVIPGYGDAWLEKGVSSWAWRVTDEGRHLTLTGWWYLLVSAPFLQFLLYRWFWRFVLWVGFLYRISRIRLALQPAHSDRAGGLSVLAMGQNAFGIVFVAVAAIMSSSLAHHILFDGLTIAAVQLEVIIFVLSCVALIVAPLFLFLGQLYWAKRKGQLEYGILGYRLSQAFQTKWISGVSVEQGGGLMDTADSSAMADYTAAYETVRDMRVLPISPRNTIILALTFVAPFIPLVFTKISITEALKRIVQTLI